MAELTEQPSQSQLNELAPLEVIRTETVLSKLPVHNLAKQGKVDIHIIRKNDHGAVDLKWEVSYNERYGQARQLAYKLDTIVINQRIDELDRPLPKIIKLGSLRDIGTELGFTSSGTQKIKNALKQNAGVFLNAILTYKGRDGSERRFEIADTRYGIIFTGEKLPNGTKADAVYLVLHQPYWEVLNNAPDRPLNYAYLKALSPSPQRWYELVSFRIFTAIKYHQPRAKMLYSEYCTAAPQPRYYESDPVKKQMYKIHKPHKQSGYLEKVSYEFTLDSEGKPDWWLLYNPGPKALAEYRAFHKKTSIQEKDSPNLEGQGNPNSVRTSEKNESHTFPALQTSEHSDNKQAVELVRYFYSLFHKVKQVMPQSKELEHAERLIRDHGVAKAKYIVLFAHKAAPETNFVPATFGGILHYTARALADFQQQRHSRQQAQAKAQQQQQEERQLHEERERRAQLSQRYQSLPPEEQARLQEQAKTNLLQQGHKPETMFAAVVNSEIYRLMEARETK